MRIEEMAQGMAIFNRYDPAGFVEAGHDVIWGGTEPDPGPCDLSSDKHREIDISKLEALGWHWSLENSCWEAFV